MNVDKNPVIFIILAAITILVGTLITTFIPLFAGITAVSTENIRPYTALELEGRDIYIREGCNNCHTQTVRPLPFETARYGSYSELEDSAIDRPHLWGSKRTGPDLARVGTKYPAQWHYMHMKSPQSMYKRSNMPPYPWLGDRKLDTRYTAKKMKVLDYPFPGKDAKDLDGKTEMDALVSYLMRLGKEVKGTP
ncbi:MAG: cytochrome oxidase subunit II [Nitrospirae bacterium GWC2_57_13]|jgi:cytochrome c oxidase cbb3-type subunit II|nr:MAG: cytochrome oxidase subunit II [Nitrospirae bacterium GWC2_57_13]HAS52911.1 cytochrome oxidase subunit II [Nitrospiraceae bacterium]